MSKINVRIFQNQTLEMGTFRAERFRRRSGGLLYFGLQQRASPNKTAKIEIQPDTA